LNTLKFALIFEVLSHFELQLQLRVDTIVL